MPIRPEGSQGFWKNLVSVSESRVFGFHVVSSRPLTLGEMNRPGIPLKLLWDRGLSRFAPLTGRRVSVRLGVCITRSRRASDAAELNLAEPPMPTFKQLL